MALLDSRTTPQALNGDLEKTLHPIKDKSSWRAKTGQEGSCASVMAATEAINAYCLMGLVRSFDRRDFVRIALRLTLVRIPGSHCRENAIFEPVLSAETNAVGQPSTSVQIFPTRETDRIIPGGMMDYVARTVDSGAIRSRKVE
jgi:hypothetical protein